MRAKKLLTTLLALLLAFTLTVPAFAAGTELPDIPTQEEPAEQSAPPEQEQFPSEAPPAPEDAQPPEDVPESPDDIQEPTSEDEPLVDPVPPEDVINVLVPSSGELVINPYGLEVDMDGDVSTDQIVHSCQTLINLSDFPVIVDVSVTGTIPAESGAGFVSAPPAQDAPGKDVFLYAEFQQDPSVWVGEYWDLPYQVLADNEGESVLTLEAGGEGYFRMFGAMSVYPEEPWSDTDTFGAVLSFTFTPVYPDPEPVEEPEAPEEEIPEEPENPDIPEEAPPEDYETPDVPEEVPPEALLPPDVPEETPPEEITPPDITEEEGPAPPDGAPPEDPAPPPEDPVPPSGEEDHIPEQTTEDQAEAWSSLIFYTPTGSPVKYLRSRSKTWLAAADRTRSRPRPFPQESFWQTVPSAEARAM